MDIYQAEKLVRQLHGDNAKLEFDDNCHREINFVFTEGKAHGVNHVAFNRVKVVADGVQPYYLDIQPHRMNWTWNALKKYINARSEFHVGDPDLHVLSDLQSLPNDHQDKWQYETKLNELVSLSEISRDSLLAKMEDYKANRKTKS